MQETTDIRELNERIQRESSFVDILTMEMNKVIVGQKAMIERLLIGLLSNGHILLEGVPGLAKTLMVHTIADVLDLSFNRIQFTPDLMPSDIIGSEILNENRCVLVVTHDSRIFEYADKIMKMEDGAVTAIENKSEVK